MTAEPSGKAFALNKKSRTCLRLGWVGLVIWRPLKSGGKGSSDPERAAPLALFWWIRKSPPALRD